MLLSEIRVVIPFTLARLDGEVEFYEGHVIDSGGPMGTVFGRIDNRENSWESRKQAGYFASDLADSYRKYERQCFVDTLNDWKWFGRKNEPPSWYTGKNWS